MLYLCYLKMLRNRQLLYWMNLFEWLTRKSILKPAPFLTRIFILKKITLFQEYNSYVIIQVIKYKEFDVIQVLFKASSFFNALTVGTIILMDKIMNEKFTLLFNIWTQLNLRKSYATRLKSLNKILFLWWNNAYVISKGYNQVNLRLSFYKIMFLDHQKISEGSECLFLFKEGWFLHLGNFKIIVVAG